MADRTRLLVAYLLRRRAQIAVDVLRQILRSSEIERIAPHITLIPPTNVAQARADELSRALEEVVTTIAPMSLWLRGVATFQPDARVLYLPVHGELDALHRLRARCEVGEFVVKDERSFVPHVTVKSHASADLVASALSMLEAFDFPVVLDRVAILERDLATAHGIWEIRDEFVLGSSHTSGRGGREVTCSRSSFVNDSDRRFLTEQGCDPEDVAGSAAGEVPDVVVVRARVAGSLVGICVLSARGSLAEIGALVVDAQRRRQGIGRQILKYVDRCAEDLAIDEIFTTADKDESEFFLGCGFADARPAPEMRTRTRLARTLWKG